MSAFKEHNESTVYNFSGFVRELDKFLNDECFTVDAKFENEMYDMLLAVVDQMNFTLNSEA